MAAQVVFESLLGRPNLGRAVKKEREKDIKKKEKFEEACSYIDREV